jgi:tRNA 2-thiouridine synthesizing protein E
MKRGTVLSGIELLADGRLANLDDWNRDVASELAARDGLELNDDHWKVIDTMRSYYQEFGVSPVKKLLKRSLAQNSGSTRFDDQRLQELFPNDVLVQGSRIAGIPLPHLDVELDHTTWSAKAAPASSASHFTGSFEFQGKQYPVTQLGNLIDLHLWNEQVAEHMAKKEGIELGDDHWQVLHFLRKFYFEYGISPMVKILQKHIAEELGPEKASREWLYRLFPGGPSRQGSRIAGLPEPQGCIDM